MGTGGEHSSPHCPCGSLISTRDVFPCIRPISGPLQERHRATLFGQCCKSRRDGWNRKDQEIWHKSQPESITWAKNRFIKGMDFKAHRKIFEAH